MKKYVFLILTLVTFLMTSCSNIIEPSENKCEYVSVSGNITLDGAYPTLSNRTAFPVTPSSLEGLTVNVIASDINAENYRITGNPGSDNTSYTISIPVESTNRTYKIKITAKKGSTDYLYGESDSFTISTSNPAYVKNIKLRSVQNSGQGSLKLIAGAPGSSINSARFIYYAGDDRTNNTPQIITATKNQSKYTFEKGTISSNTITDGIDSGSYLMDFEFYSGSNCTGNLMYSFSQRVNIFNLQETNTWVKNGGEPYLTVSDTSTQCLITATLTNEFKLTEIYVDSTPTLTTNESGTFLNPCHTLSAAITKLKDKNKDYKIYIKGSLSGRQEIPDTLTDTSSGDYHARSVTLIGYNGLDEHGIPRDSLNGGFMSATSNGVTLKITSSVPVIIKNLMITGGNNSEDGGGIYSTGKLTLDSGTYVYDNWTRTCGGGVMNNGGELTIKSGAVIANNTAYNTASDTNYTYGGGGVYNYNGKLVMSGGQIKANTSKQCGGGIYNHMDDKDKITELYIYGDAVIGGDTDADGNKANIEVDGYGGGGIYNRGGLVYMGCTAYSAAGDDDSYDYYEPDASKLVPWTGKISHNISKAWGGGYLNMFSSASSDGLSDAEKIKTTGITHMMSGQISANTAVKGGGIAVHNGSLCPIHGGIIGGSSSADGNAASQMGGGIYTMTKLNVYDATISNNSAPAGGGIYNVGILNFGGTIKNNSATSYGGGIFNEYRLQLKENAYIPAGTGGANDIYYTVAENPLSDTAPYIMISRPINLPSDSDGIVATITPSLYENGKTILTCSTSATTTLPNEVGKFAITPSVSRKYRIDGEGKLKALIGTKFKPDAVGDIVFNDGSATPYTNGMTITDEENSAAIALIFYIGTGLNSGNDTTTSRTLGVGLKHDASGLYWCHAQGDAYYYDITTIRCSKSGSEGAYTFTGDKNGSDNFEQIAAFSGVNDTNSKPNYYSAFYFAKQYKDKKIGAETTSRIISGSEFASGWYLPSIAELFQIYACRVDTTNGFNIDTASQALGGDTFGTSTYWSSTQKPSETNNAYSLNFYGGEVNDWYKSGPSSDKYHVCCIREFN